MIIRTAQLFTKIKNQIKLNKKYAIIKINHKRKQKQPPYGGV